MPTKLKGELKRVLTPRETELLKLITAALSDKEIAVAMNISTETVKSLGYFIRNKIGADNRVGMAMWAVRTGLVKLDD